MEMQVLEFTTDLMLLPLRGCDTVLGIQLLKRLGPILWYLSQLQIEFQVKGQKIVLRGSLESNLKVIERKQLKKMVLDDIALSAFHLCFIHTIQQEGNKSNLGKCRNYVAKAWQGIFSTIVATCGVAL